MNTETNAWKRIAISENDGSLNLMPCVERHVAVKDHDGHWYYIPAKLEQAFYKDESEGESDSWTAFNDKWTQYRTHGAPDI